MFRSKDSSGSRNRQRLSGLLKSQRVASVSRLGSLEQLEERYALAANLIADINTTGNDSRPSQLATVGSVSYFKATTPGFGTELWKSDGTEAGTVLVKDIFPGAEGGLQFGSLVGVGGNGFVYFIANDGVHGFELWRTDGTTEGTLLVKDLVVGEGNGGLRSSMVIGNTVYFSNATPNSAYSLWKSDGSEAGTVLVRNGVRADSFANVNGTLFFRGFDFNGPSGLGDELWKSDGTSAGTVMVKDIEPTFGGSSNPQSLTNLSGTLYFKANGVQGYELWRSDGTEAGTTLVKDIAPGSTSSNPSSLTNKDGSLFFIASDGTNGYELWNSDGTEAGTAIVKDIRSGAQSSLFQNMPLTQAGGFFFFQADDGLAGRELWKSDGTSEGTVLVAEISPGSSGGEPSSITEVNGRVYFSANGPVGGRELWTSDGTPSGTVLVRDINTSLTLNPSSFPTQLTNVNGTLLFTAFEPTFGYELWKSDGTSNGTLLVKNIAAGTANSNATELAEVNGTIFFSANDPTRGPELWKTNGTSAGTVLVKEIAFSTSGSSPHKLTNLNGTLLFQAGDFSSGFELWKSDGTQAGTVIVKDISPGPASAFDLSTTAMTVIGDSIFFTATDGINGQELWKSDGTAAGTLMVKDIRPGSSGSKPTNLMNVGGSLYFSANNGTNGYQLWKSDGTAEGTIVVGTGRIPRSLTNVNGTLYFNAFSPGLGYELWKSDGTENGTALVKDIFIGNSLTSGNPSYLVNVNGTLYFTANDGVNGAELWKSDGTSSGTSMIKDIRLGLNASSPKNLTNVNGMLMFGANNEVAGEELWRSDGTTDGTVLVSDMNVGSVGASPRSLTNINGELYFSANDGQNGEELWKSDGTTEGTSMVADVFSGPAGSSPGSNIQFNGTRIYASMYRLDRRIVFAATDGSHGEELWIYTPPALPTVEFSSASATDSEASGGNIPKLLINGTLSVSASINVSISGTANLGQDFTQPLSITIPAGTYDGTLATAITIGLTINDDNTFEADETIQLTLVNPSSKIEIGDASASGGTSITHTYTINNDDVPNGTPTGLNLSTTTIAENNSASAIVGTFTTDDPNFGDAFTYNLADGYPDNAAFSISGNSLTASATFDYESKNLYSIFVRTTDAGGLFYEQSFTINVTNVNEAPNTLSLSANTIAENNTANALVGVFTSTDPDVGDGVTYGLVAGSGDNAAFTLAGNNLHINSSSDFETKNVYHIRVRAIDTDGLSLERTLTISVNDVNESPTALSLSSSTISENNPVNAVVGNLSSVDLDLGDAFVYSFVAGMGDTDNNVFAISGNTLTANSTFDFETKNAYEIRVRTTDAGGLYFEKSLVIHVLQENVAPINLSLSTTLIVENNLVGAAIGNFTTNDPNSGDSFVYSLTSGEGSNDNTAFSVNGSQLLAAVSFNYETKNTYSIRMRTTDAGGLFFEQIFVISVTNENEAPSAPSLSTNSIPESSTINATIGALSSSDQDGGDIVTYSFVPGVGAQDNTEFTIANSSLLLNTNLDFESKSTYSIRVRATDPGGKFAETILTVNVADENESPINLELSSTSISENNAPNAVVGSFITSDPDTLDNFTYSFATGNGDSDNGAFSISGNTLTANQTFDFEAKNAYKILVRTTDATGLFYERALVIHVLQVNDAPTGLSLTANTIAENNLIGTAIGILVTSDPNSNDNFSYSLVTGDGSDDNSAFSINGFHLVAATSFNYEARNAYSVRLRTTDAGGLFFEQAIAISVTNVNEAPTALSLSATTIDENNSQGAAIGNLVSIDPDSDDTFVYSIVTGPGDDDNYAFSISDSSLTANWIFDFESKSTYHVRVRTTDKLGLSFDREFAISILEKAEPPFAIGITSSTIAENNLVGASIGQFSSLDSDLDDSFTYSLVPGSSDNVAFSIVGSTLLANAIFDYESKSSYNILVRSTDSTGLYLEQSFVIAISNANEAPILFNPIVDLHVPIGTTTTEIDLTTVFADFDDSVLAYTVQSDNETLLSTTIVGTHLVIEYIPGNRGLSTINVSAMDSGELSVSDQFSVTVEDAVPQIAVSGPLDGYSGVTGQRRMFRLTTTDLFNDGNQPYTYQVRWGDGPQVYSFTGSTTIDVGYPYKSTGNVVAEFRVIDGDNNASQWVTKSLNIARSEVQGTVLAVGGITGNDTFTLTPGAAAPTVQLALNGASLGNFAVPADGVTYYSLSPSDTVVMNGTSGSDVFTADSFSILWNGNAAWPQPVRLNSANNAKMRVQAQGGNDTVLLTSLNVEVDGGAGTDRLVGNNFGNTWNITAAGGGTLNGFSFANIENISGGTSSDTFALFANGSIVGTVDGGGNFDTIDYNTRSTAITTSVANNTTTSTGGFLNIERFVGSSSPSNVFTGSNLSNTWQVGANNSTVLNFSTTIVAYASIIGGGLADQFIIGSGLISAPKLNGGSGSDTLSFSGRNDPIVIDRVARTATGVSSFDLIENFVGGNARDLLIGSDTATAWTITSSGVGSFTGGTFAGFEQLRGGFAADTFTLLNGTINGEIDGGGGIDLLTGFDRNNFWYLSGPQSGSLNSALIFSNIESLKGATSADTFFVAASNISLATVDGGAGVDTLDYSSQSTSLQVDLANRTSNGIASFLAIETLVGSQSSDTLFGPSSASTWNLTGLNAGTVGTVSFQSFESIVAGSGNDTLNIAGAGRLTGSFNGSAGSDTIIGPSFGQMDWNILTAGGGDVNGVAFLGIENVTGGSSVDRFLISSGGSISGVISGGASPTGFRDQLSYALLTGPIVVDLANKTQPQVGSFTGIEELVGSLSAADELRGANVVNAWSLTGINEGTLGTLRFVGVENLTGGTSADSFSLAAGGSTTGTLRGGTGIDTLVGPNTSSVWSVASSNAGSINSVAFSEFENLTGGSGVDQFLLSADVSGTINGGAAPTGGRDQLSYASVTGPVVIDLQLKTQPLVFSFVGIEELIGTNSSTDELRGADSNNTWLLTSVSTGTVGTFRFVGFESLKGGNLADVFSLVGGSVSNVDGGGGTDTLQGPSTATTWNLNGAGLGVVATTNFNAIENLTGSTAGDVFNIAPSGALLGALNGGASAKNTLSYASWTNPVIVNLATKVASAIGGAVTNFTIVIGGNGNDQLTGNATLGSVLARWWGSDVLSGGSVRDILIGGFGGDIMTGGAGDDLLIAGATIYDNDVISLSSIFDEWSNTSRNYQTRVINLRGIGSGPRSNGNFFLQTAPNRTLYAEPGLVDQLIGGLGQDWYITDDATDSVDQVMSGSLAELRDEVVVPPA